MTTSPNPSVDELLAAYADDPASLTAAERAMVEARLAEDEAAVREVGDVRALLGDVRAHGDVADAGTDWAALEAGIRAATTPVIDRGARRAARWRWAAGAGVALAAAAGLALWWQHRRTDDEGFALARLVPVVRAPDAAPAPDGERAAEPDDDDALDDDVLGELALDGESDLGGAIDLGDLDHDDLIGHAVERVPVADLEAEDGLFPGLDTAWLDDLSEREVEQALRWLDEQGAG